MFAYLRNIVQAFGTILAISCIPYSMVLLAQIVIGVASGARGSGKEYRYRDSPRKFWKAIGRQVIWIVLGSLIFAIIVGNP